MAEIPQGALSAEQYQLLASYGVQPSAAPPVEQFVASMPGASPTEILQAASSTPSLAQAVIERFDIANAGDITFENPYRAGINEALVLGALEVLSGVGGATFGGSSSPRQLTWQDPQVNFPRGLDRIYVPGTEPPPGNRLPVPYEPPPQPGPFAFGIGGIGAILGGVIAGMWEGWPNALDPELGPYDTRAPSASPNDETPAEGPEFGPPSVQQLPGDYIDNPMPLPFPDFGGGPSQDALPGDIDLGPVPDMGPPQGARQPAPAPAPAPAPHVPPWVWPVIGGIAAIQLGRSGRSRSSQTLPEISVLPSPGVPGLDVNDLTALIEPLLSSRGSTSTTTFLQSGSGGVWDPGQGQDTCNCSPKKGKKRRCLARAQLSWRSGPKKGRAAGSRCYRFED